MNNKNSAKILHLSYLCIVKNQQQQQKQQQQKKNHKSTTCGWQRMAVVRVSSK